MDIYIYDYNFNVIDTVVKYDSIIWNPKFNEPGTFEIRLPFTDRMNRELKRGNFLYKTDELEDGIITYKKLTSNKYGEETILIRGYMSSFLLDRRIIWKKMILKGTTEDAMRRIVSEQFISPADSARKLPGIDLGVRIGYADTIEKQVTYENVLDTLKDLSKTSEIGFRLKPDMAGKVRIFECYRGKDRTFGSENPCVFKRGFGNVLTQTYEENEKNYKNVCLVGGSGEDEERILESVGTAAGLERREVFSNSAGASSKDITESQYRQQLRQKGSEKLAKMKETKSFSGTVQAEKNYELGDYVTCKDDEWGIIQNTQIVGIEKGYSKEEKSVYLTFGEEDPTLVELIKNSNS